MPRIIQAFAASLALVLVLTGLISLLPAGSDRQFDGADRLRDAAFCLADATGCRADPVPVTLPHRYRPPGGDGIHAARFSLRFDRTGAEDGVTAVFLPRFSDAVSLSVNGQRLLPAPWLTGHWRNFHHWHRPAIATVPNATLMPTGNRLDIDLAAHGFQDIALYPVYVGAAAPLDFVYELWGILRVGTARVNFSLVLLAGGAVLLFWLMHREDMLYFWLAAASFASAAVCYHWVYPNLLTDYRAWLTLWNTAAALQIWCTLCFVCALLRVPLRRLRLACLALLLAGSAALALLPLDAFQAFVALYQLGFILMALVMLTVLVAWRQATHPLNFAVLFGLYALALSLALAQWASRHFWADWAPSITSLMIPVAFILSLLWVIFFQLARSIAQYENLTAALQTTIDEKTAELQASYERLADRTRAQAIDEERQRILLDLHDGVGGQLVNMLAYLSARPERDAVLQAALEGALRDMGLMIDSIEAGDSIATQLGLLRGRLEPIFDEHHVDLVWRIWAEPHLPGAGPSQTLTLLRIVQEAITNAVRHAGAHQITISASEHSISVADDGHGFDLDQPASGRRAGIGLTSMKRRAGALGAQLDITSSGRGTRVVLSWPG
ncbi:sensor histidine kinase [Marinibacterium sp. SX1]|uniref:sensor histidine kinase n=1 Tax=Marinibacterium sp. SX1 TaxID=3388424 RepID=UPI003D1764D5